MGATVRGLALKGLRLNVTAQEAWVWMRAHQEEFQRLLDALIAGRPTLKSRCRSY